MTPRFVVNENKIPEVVVVVVEDASPYPLETQSSHSPEPGTE